MVNSGRLFNATRFPVVEIPLAVMSGLVGMAGYMYRARTAGSDPESDVMVFSFVVYALSGVIALIWRPLVDAAKAAIAWIHFIPGVGIVAWYGLYFARQEQGGFDIFLMPLGLGIIFGTAGSLIHRFSKGAPSVDEAPSA
ncbi:MAG: hypothetical protein L0K74_05125 [Acidipropionibacterium acidipropionici]|nr:hypothetical protein [Acidipropionibacterium acidipropionici]